MVVTGSKENLGQFVGFFHGVGVWEAALEQGGVKGLVKKIKAQT